MKRVSLLSVEPGYFPGEGTFWGADTALLLCPFLIHLNFFTNNSLFAANSVDIDRKEFKKLMAITSTDLLVEGMVLEAPVKNMQGQVLFGIGHILKEKHIEMIQAWGITEVEVKVAEDSESEKKYREAVAREEVKLQPVFKRCDLTNPVVKEILRNVAELKVESQMKEQA